MGAAEEVAREELRGLEKKGLLRRLEALRTRPGAVVELAEGERLVNFSSNDYLGLAGDARLADALAQGARRWGAGAGASRLVTGDFTAQHELEAALAAFEGTEAAVLFNSGYAANCGLVATFAGPGDLVVSDALNHASIIDACRLSRAEVAIYPHRDADAAEALLRRPARRKLLVSDSIFSMDGDAAPLAALAAACARHGAMLAVDEAHATGVLGPRGAGLVAREGIACELRMGTLSKALGVAGAYVAGPRAVCELLVNRARPLVFSTALPPALACAALEALRIASGPEGDARRATLRAHVARVCQAVGVASDSAIVPIVLGAPERALAAAARLRQRGLLVKAIRPPTVPEGTSRLRIALSAAHTPAQIGALLDAAL